MNSRLIAPIGAAGLCLALTASAAGGGRFEAVTEAAGIAHRHAKPILDHKLDNISAWVSSVGAAVATADYDGDGHLDLYVTDSRKGRPNYLYRNRGDGTFVDVARSAGVADLNGDDGVSMDCAWGDYDNDGDPDLYLVRWGHDALFRNDGDGTFTDVTADVFVRRDGEPGTQWANGNAVIFMDFDLDGRLDVYVGNYFAEIDLWNLESTSIMHDDFEKARNGGVNFMYHQAPDGTFKEVASKLGIDDPGWTLAVGSGDVNNDGWPDLYLADDFGPDQLFVNAGDGTFRNVSREAIGVDTRKGMNVDFGDFNNDGWLDIYVTNITTAEYLQEGNMLWHNDGLIGGSSLMLTDVALETGTYDGGWGWGAKFFDADNDGDLDIIALNGFISAGEGDYWYDLASWTVTDDDPTDARNWPAIGDRSFSGHEATRFWRNDGFGSFSERAAQVGLASVRDGRGVVCFDYDHDGDLDLFIANQNDVPELYRNDAADGAWLTVALVVDPATGVNRDGLGARVTVVTDAGAQIREREGGNGFCGQSDPRLHFGLGKAPRVSLLEVRWPDGGLQYLEDVEANQHLVVRQDPARYAERMAISVDAPSPWAGDRGDEAAPSATELAAVDGQLDELERQLRSGPCSRLRASRYRQLCATYGRHDRSIAFFRKLAAKRPGDSEVALNLACAYVDKIPTCGGIAAIVSKGTLARRALDVLDAEVAADPEAWLALYCRGMNHLHWPRALRHSDDAAADFRRCIALQASGGGGAARPYYVRPHVALGDALVKHGQPDRARAAWREAIRLFPGSVELKERLRIGDDDALLEFVEEARNLELPIDTDLAFVPEPDAD